MANVDPTRGKTLFRRILVPSLLVLSLGMALLALLQWLHTRALIKNTLTSESEQVMAATDSALHYLMLQADEEGLQKTLDRLAASQDIRRAYILGISGSFYRSSGKAASDPVPSNALEDARRAALHVSEETDGDREYLRSLKPIVAEQSCLSCHSGVRNGDPIGYIGIERWMDASTAEARSMQVWAAAMDVLILLAMGLVLAYLIRKVTGPIQKMTATAQLLAAGDLDSDLTYTAEDEIGDLAEAMRSLTGYLRELCRLADALSRGDLTVELTARSADDALTEKLNQARTSLGGVIQEIEEVARAAAQGDLSRRGNHQAFQGAFRQMVQSVNTTLDAVLDPIQEATRVLERVAGRDLTARVRGNYHGDHARVKQAVNQAVENLEASLQQVAASASQVAAASGQISSGSQSLAQGSSQQASTLQEVASSLQEVASMAASNASFAQEAQTLAVQARKALRGHPQDQGLGG
jgi:methyl-accepting chemotaxis protein